VTDAASSGPSEQESLVMLKVEVRGGIGRSVVLVVEVVLVEVVAMLVLVVVGEQNTRPSRWHRRRMIRLQDFGFGTPSAP